MQKPIRGHEYIKKKAEILGTGKISAFLFLCKKREDFENPLL